MATLSLRMRDDLKQKAQQLASLCRESDACGEWPRSFWHERPVVADLFRGRIALKGHLRA
jgi:hypothetical protein